MLGPRQFRSPEGSNSAGFRCGRAGCRGAPGWSMLAGMPMDSTSRRGRRGLIRGILLVLLLLFWFGGAAGWLLRQVLFAAAPREGRHHRILALNSPVREGPATGVVVQVSASRLRRLAREALGWRAYALPPGLLPERLTALLELRVRLDDEADAFWLPVLCRIDPEAPQPRIRARLPSGMVNDALDYEDSFARREKTRRYALGRYSMIHALRFDTVELRSVLSDRQRGRAVTHRRIEGQATGQVRFKVEENWLTARMTARVRRMSLRCDLDFRKYVDGLALAHKISIPDLDADIRNLAPLLEGRLVEALREALEDSIARPRNLERLARRRLPLYLPLDTDLELSVFHSEG